MENKIRFRNHFSIVLPNFGSFFWALFVLTMTVFVGFLSEDGSMKKMLISILIEIGIIALLLGYQILIWAKTWITISEQSIVIECNTFWSRRKNTIGIANISNVNLEQGLFAMLLGTCKLKLDTNSLSTADSTDVTIVLKKQAAEEIRALLVARVSEQTQEGYVVGKEVMEECAEQSEICLGVKEILLHGVFAARFLVTFFVPLYILLEFVSEMDEKELDYLINEVGSFAEETVGLGILILIAFVAWGVLAALFGLIRSVVKYWDFKIERKDDKLMLKYGLTNKVNYSIPVDKIQAVVLKQSVLARICRQYTVEVVNVGMNDDKEETRAFLLPYCNKIVLEKSMKKLLPEFGDCLKMKAERQPKSIWLVWLWPVFIYLLIVSVILLGVLEFIPEAIGVAGGILGVMVLTIFAVKIASYLTKGTHFGEKVLLVVNGSFSRKFVFVKYEKIEHVSLKQNLLAKRCGIQSGNVSLLASMKKRMQEIPYFEEEKIEFLKGKL